MKDFYVYLPSITKHMGNTAGKFIVPLAQPYELVGEWEVRLMEIQYARTWYNVPNMFKLGIEPFQQVFMLT